MAKLTRYRPKRDISSTSEPRGGSKEGVGNRFVIHKHAATADHNDLRLELDGVLKSWAVPKGPSLDPDEKRLVVETWDHPIEYRDFEASFSQANMASGR